jgi:hypothetical protein
MIEATLDRLEKERESHENQCEYHKEMVGILGNMIAETKAIQKKFLSGKDSIPARNGRKGRPPGRPGNKINKSEKIREILRSDPNAGNKDVVAVLGKDGITVTDGLVCIIRKKFLDEGVGKSKKGKKSAKKDAKTTASAKLKVIIREILGKSRNKQGLKLADLSEEIINAGYETTSKKGPDGLPAIVYQALRQMQEGKATVVHNKQSHRYRLKRKNAA